MSKKTVNKETLDNIARRAHYFATQMIHIANNRKDKSKGDPKIGGHPAACASALHIMGALHLVCKSGFDHLCNKPHASPTDHSYNYLLDLFLNKDFSKLTTEEKDTAMTGLRKFSKNGEPVFQSYHSAYDSDNHNFAPSGTVGIPPVNIGYLALAYRYAKQHGHDVPDAHFWSLMGDSEYREGSLHEALPEFAERELGNLTWIVDYNRQSLDGHRITNNEIMNGTDDQRIENTAIANGWEVIQIRHGAFRKELFNLPEGKSFQTLLENDLTDYELQTFLLIEEPKDLRDAITKDFPKVKKFLDSINDNEVYQAIRDFGGHDFLSLIDAMEASKKNQKKPTLIIAHTLKGWGLNMAATQGCHSALPTAVEVEELRKEQLGKNDIENDLLFSMFDEKSNEAKFLKKRGDELYKDILAQEKIRSTNIEKMRNVAELIPDDLNINLKMVSYPHTQWMLGQLTSKLSRIANTADHNKLTDFEKNWHTPAQNIVSMAPDVGTSTNLNPSMDGKVFSSYSVEDYETEYGVKDGKLPDLIPGEEDSDRFIRFEIVESNVMSCVGSFGRMRETLGLPILPLMTIYDFFVKRAHDQFFYNLYWKSSFICIGTPAGVSLSPEGAQHGWKSDFQIPNQVTWEPFYCVEFDWILSDAIKRHYSGDNTGRSGVYVRGTTVGIEQKDMIKRLRKHQSNDGLEDTQIMEKTRLATLSGAYHLIDYKGFDGYEPGDNVVNIFALGPLVREAISASDTLLEKGIYANVIVVTSHDLLVGNLAEESDFSYLKNSLQIDSALHLHQNPGSHDSNEITTLAGRRVPIVSVHDGEPGLLDNLGSIIGVKQISLAVKQHSKCGRPVEIYNFHKMDAEAIIEATGKVLSETALEEIKISPEVLASLQNSTPSKTNWRSLWPEAGSSVTENNGAVNGTTNPSIAAEDVGW